jgi:hypothetical protein
VEPRTPAVLTHILAHIARLDLLLSRAVRLWRDGQGVSADDDLRGLYVTDQEVDDLLATPLGVGFAPASDDASLLSSATDRISALEDANTDYPLRQLAKVFGLSDFEVAVLVLCLAPELDLKYERLYGYLQDDVTKKRPTVDLALRLLCADLPARVAARSCFAPDSPLVRWRLISLHDDPGARRPVLLARYIKLDDPLVSWLLGAPYWDERLEPAVAPRVSPLSPALTSLATRATTVAQANSGGCWIGNLAGPYGAGKRALAGEIALRTHRSLLLLSIRPLLGAERALEEGFLLAQRQALLEDRLLAWDAADLLLDHSDETLADRFFKVLRTGQAPALLLTDKPWEPGRRLGERSYFSLELPSLTARDRARTWRASLNGRGDALGNDAIADLAERFQLTAGQIEDAAARADQIAAQRQPGSALTLSDLEAACRAQAQHRLAALAVKITPRRGWADIVLPRPQISALHLICTTIRHRALVYGDWGFDRKLSQGKGLIALFSGPSGTGKTLAAEIIAHELALDLYRVDLAALVSKYVGETEKNLERVFTEAHHSNAILFFDEADALFGKRSEVKDAHDRYANIEIAYLLQRTEAYDGLVILTSNVKKNIDEAFVRRIHFILDFPFPEEAERLEIWRRTFPPETPLGSDLDLPFLAHKLKVSGGNIRNIILTGAFLAAEEESPVKMRHLVRGAAFEMQKLGKLVVESDFEHYIEQARGQ